MAIDIGRIAFEAHAKYLGNIDLHWEHLDKIGQDAWRHAAVAVLQYIDKEQKKDRIESLNDEIICVDIIDR